MGLSTSMNAFQSAAERNSIMVLWELRALWLVSLSYFLSLCLYLVWLVWPRPQLGRTASRLFLVGIIIHCVAVILRTVEVGNIPYHGQFEILMGFTFLTAVTYIFIERRIRDVLVAGGPVAGICLILCLWGILYSNPGNVPLLPTLQSGWFALHCTITLVACTVFAVALAIESGHLILTRYISFDNFTKYCKDIETAARFHRFAHQLISLGFPMLTAAIWSGMAWDVQAHGRYWTWYPHLTWMLIALTVFAAYLHAMTLAQWRGGRASALNMLGFICVLMALGYMGSIPELLAHAYLGAFPF
jgi:ABC-type transport system involved in cytochrome c biogenesis permease subunit